MSKGCYLDRAPIFFYAFELGFRLEEKWSAVKVPLNVATFELLVCNCANEYGEISFLLIAWAALKKKDFLEQFNLNI